MRYTEGLRALLIRKDVKPKLPRISLNNGLRALLIRKDVKHELLWLQDEKV